MVLDYRESFAPPDRRFGNLFTPKGYVNFNAISVMQSGQEKYASLVSVRGGDIETGHQAGGQTIYENWENKRPEEK
jgi:hypothetical protein